jgi:small subunit ribosomal protein S11
MAKKKILIQVPKATIHIIATFNNTHISFSDTIGRPFIKSSTGKYGFTGARKATPHAATTTSEALLKAAIEEHGVQEAIVYVKGVGPGREAVLRSLKTAEIDVHSIIDITPIPHNGVRPPKVRRG